MTVCPSLPGSNLIYALFLPSCGSPLSPGFVDIVTLGITSVCGYFLSNTYYLPGIVLNVLYLLSNVGIYILQLGTNFNPTG